MKQVLSSIIGLATVGGVISEGVAYMDVGKGRELGAEALGWLVMNSN